MSAPRIVLDVFPSNIIVAPKDFVDDIELLQVKPDVPNTLYKDVTRIVVTDSRIIVAADSPDGAQIIGNEEYESFFRGSKPDYLSYVITKSGKQIAFYKDNGCGCGSRLRSWNPYKTLYSTRG